MRLKYLSNTLQQRLIEQLKKTGMELLSSEQIKTEFAPFSGGDIVMFYDTPSNVITTATGLKPNSPTEDDEAKVAFDFEPVLTDSNDCVRQLLANMMVASGMLLERMCKNNDERLHHLKQLSVYGLAMHLLLPLPLYKLTIDFEEKSLVITNEANCESQCMRLFVVADKLLTCMIRNTCSNC